MQFKFGKLKFSLVELINIESSQVEFCPAKRGTSKEWGGILFMIYILSVIYFFVLSIFNVIHFSVTNFWCYPFLVLLLFGVFHLWCYPFLVLSISGVIHICFAPLLVISMSGLFYCWWFYFLYLLWFYNVVLYFTRK